MYLYLKNCLGEVGNKIHILVLLAIMTGVLESIGILTIAPLMESVGSISEGEVDLLWLPAKLVEVKNEIGETSFYAMAIGFIFLLKGVGVFLLQNMIAVIKSEYGWKMRDSIYRRYVNTPYESSLTRNIKSSHRVNLATEQVTRAALSLHHFSQAVILSCKFLLLISSSIYANVTAGLISIFFGVIVFSLLTPLRSYVSKISHKHALMGIDFSSRIAEIFNHEKYLKANNISNTVGGKVFTGNKALQSNERNLGFANAITSSIKEPIAISMVAIFFIVFEGGSQIYTATASLLLMYRATISAFGVQKNIQNGMEYSGSIQILKKELYVESLDDKVIGVKVDPSVSINSIVVSNLSFGYKKDSLLLEKVNVNLSKGRLIALIGQSGSGKTTMLDVMSGLLSSNTGTCNLMTDDGQLKLVNSEFVSYLTQSPALMAGSMKENISLLCQKPLDEERVESYLSLFGLSAFIKDKKKNWKDYDIGYYGDNLSGGQKQRLCIIRHLMNPAPIMFFDEPTSALDGANEDKVFQCLQKLAKDSIIIVSTHSEKIRDYCSVVYDFDSGEVINNV